MMGISSVEITSITVGDLSIGKPNGLAIGNNNAPIAFRDGEIGVSRLYFSISIHGVFASRAFHLPQLSKDP